MYSGGYDVTILYFHYAGLLLNKNVIMQLEIERSKSPTLKEEHPRLYLKWEFRTE
jgi:hypothetical protein